MGELDYEPCRADRSGPCLNEVVERHKGVTVEVLRCRRCGRRTVQWMRPELAALEEALVGEAEDGGEGPPHQSAAPTASPQGEAFRTSKTDDEPEPRDYWEAVEEFLKELQRYRVRSLAMVALTNDPAAHDVTSVWGAGPFELSDAAGVLQLHAGYMFQRANEDEDDEDEDDEDEGEEDDDDGEETN